MNSNIPTFRPVAWISLIPQLIILGLVILLWYQFTEEDYVLYGALTYLLISQLLRRILTIEHRRGIAKVRQEKFEEAIPHFEKSYAFFKKYNWIDKFRFIALLSSAKMWYREMALTNIAFCYGQLGNGELSLKYYQQTLEEFPDSGMALAGLKMLNSMRNNEVKAEYKE